MQFNHHLQLWLMLMLHSHLRDKDHQHCSVLPALNSTGQNRGSYRAHDFQEAQCNRCRTGHGICIRQQKQQTEVFNQVIILENMEIGLWHLNQYKVYVRRNKSVLLELENLINPALRKEHEWFSPDSTKMYCSYNTSGNFQTKLIFLN